MTEFPETDMRQDLPGGASVGVMDAMREAWRVLMSDFWRLWLVVFVLFAINLGLTVINSIPYLGSCTSLATGIFVQPALAAGLFFAILRRIDGGPADVSNLFAGFQYRYWQSVLANLIILGITLGVLLGVAIVFGGMCLLVAVATDAFHKDQPPVALILCLVTLVPVAFLIMVLVGLHFIFAFLAVWDHPESGWGAVKTSVLTVWHNFWSVVGMAFLFLLVGVLLVLPAIVFGSMVAFGSSGRNEALMGIGIAASVACALGYVLVLPAFSAWYNATLIYLYRSWTGQPLVQPIAVQVPAEGAGPVAPTDIEPPPVPPTDVLPPGV